MMQQLQSHMRTTLPHQMRNVLLLALAALLIALPFAQPTQAAVPARQHMATPAPGNDTGGGMMGEGKMGKGMMKSDMSMAEMGAMMDEMMAQMDSMMASMPMTGTMPMAEMGQSMYMMGMMHQRMGQMQMKMGAMMTGQAMGDMGGMMASCMMGKEMMKCSMMEDGMMGKGMMNKSATPSATQDHSGHGATPEATSTPEPAGTPAPSTTPAATATPEPAASPEAAASPQAAATEDHSGHAAPAMAAAPQTATVGAVTVEIAPLTTEDVLDVAFAVTLDTHSVDLSFDLAEHATLIIGDAEFAATSWTPDAGDGHHVTGVLRFTIDHPAHGELYNVGEVGLHLHGIDGQDTHFGFALE
jgi:hypothetical protein